jgi:beta-aspartyl-peptidase (threonine type)
MILCHGGAGTVAAERHDRLRDGVRAAVRAASGISVALDAVVACVRVLEDDPEFNAGTGSALTRDGTVETDASIMDGVTGRVGAVGAVPDLGAAIAVARGLLDRGEHALVTGEAALVVAAELGIARASPDALIVERARRRLRDEAARGGGTVGAVARDRDGHFAAATSTGGLSFKRAGRIGDSPIIGAGTWADRECAISATGDGEAIIRTMLAHAIAMRRTAMPLEAAVRTSLVELRSITGLDAGVIAIDPSGFVALQTSTTMPIAWHGEDGAGDSLGQSI